jgi:Skp family chaperone for outer membrane proteins
MELADHVGYFVEEMKQHEQALKDDLADAKSQMAEEIKDLKVDLKDQKKALAKATADTERQSIERDIAEIEKEIQLAVENVPNEVELLERFKADKREFLVDYINTQVHGGDWRTKL